MQVNGVFGRETSEAVQQFPQRMRKVLLRFSGHGMSGSMAVRAGTDSLRDALGRSLCHVAGAEGFVAARSSHDDQPRNGRTRP